MDQRMNIAGRRTGVEGVQRPRVVVLDIETAALDPTDQKGALDAMSGRVVCIGMLIDDQKAITEITLADEDERRLIDEFWRTIVRDDVVVGHNVLDFDLRFLRQRSWILGIQPSRTIDTRKYYTADVIDTLQLWTEWSGNKKGATLDALGLSLGCGGRTGSGANVAKMWAERDIDSIKTYCQEDVRTRVPCVLPADLPGAERNSVRCAAGASWTGWSGSRDPRRGGRMPRINKREPDTSEAMVSIRRDGTIGFDHNAVAAFSRRGIESASFIDERTGRSTGRWLTSAERRALEEKVLSAPRSGDIKDFGNFLRDRDKNSRAKEV
jgi:3'-5' exonuclease